MKQTSANHYNNSNEMDWSAIKLIAVWFRNGARIKNNGKSNLIERFISAKLVFHWLSIRISCLLISEFAIRSFFNLQAACYISLRINAATELESILIHNSFKPIQTEDIQFNWLNSLMNLQIGFHSVKAALILHYFYLSLQP